MTGSGRWEHCTHEMFPAPQSWKCVPQENVESVSSITRGSETPAARLKA